MPNKTMRPCAYPGCTVLVEAGRCKAHSAETHAAYHKPSTVKMYNSARWRKFRAEYLGAHPWCVKCLADGKHERATVVDHVVPHGGDEEKFWGGPFQAMCKVHHDEKTAREVNERK